MRGNHWDGVYATTPSTEVSWYERDPVTSLRLIEEVADGPSVAVVDVGAGASLLVDGLLAHGFTDLTVLDVSERALSEVRGRLGKGVQRVTFVSQDVLTWNPEREYDIWHDRAVFHFLTEPTDRSRYVEIAQSLIRSGGCLVLATFAEDGPEQCSGLRVARYSAQDLAETFSESFSLIHSEREEHITPRGVVQPFTWVVLQRTEPPVLMVRAHSRAPNVHRTDATGRPDRHECVLSSWAPTLALLDRTDPEDRCGLAAPGIGDKADASAAEFGDRLLEDLHEFLVADVWLVLRRRQDLRQAEGSGN